MTTLSLLRRAALSLFAVALVAGCSADPFADEDENDGDSAESEPTGTSESAYTHGRCSAVGATMRRTDANCSGTSHYRCERSTGGGLNWRLVSCGGSGGQWCTYAGRRVSVGSGVATTSRHCPRNSAQFRCLRAGYGEVMCAD